MSLLKKTVLYNLIMAILYIIVGVLMVSKPAIAEKIICYGLGTVFAVNGILKVYDFAVSKNERKHLDTNLAIAVVHLFIGGYMIIHPAYFYNLLPLLYGILLIVNAVLNLQQGVHLIKLKDKFWWLQFLIGIAGFVFGVYAITLKLPLSDKLTSYIGAFILAVGLIEIISALRLIVNRSPKKSIQEEIENRDDTVKYTID